MTWFLGTRASVRSHRALAGVTRWVTAVLVAAVVASACSAVGGGDELACGVFDRGEVEQELGVEGVVFEGAREVRDDPPDWECVVTLPSGSRLGLQLGHGEVAADSFTRVMDTGAPVSVGYSGMMFRGWASGDQRVDGWFFISCSTSRGYPDDLAVVGEPDVSRAVEGEFDYRQLATVLTLAGGGVGHALRCRGPLSVSGGVPAGVPEVVPLGGQSTVCGVFDAGELLDVLPGGDGDTQWFVWESPVRGDPMSCQVWRESVEDDDRSVEGDVLLGPGLAFTKRGAARNYDVVASRERFGGEAWGDHLDSDGYVAQGEYRLKRQCSVDDYVVFVGRYSESVIGQGDFEQLFERWMRERAPSWCRLPEE